MAREKFQTLTEQMFYTLMCFNEECCGMDVMKKASDITEGRVNIGAGTLYNEVGRTAKKLCAYKSRPPSAFRRV